MEFQQGSDWYAIRVSPNCERRVADALKGKEFESFLPLCWQYRTWGNRIRKVQRAMIPGYVFGRFDPEKRLPVLTIPGVAYIVGTRNGPTSVDPYELAVVRKIAQSSAMSEPWPFLAAGQPITLEYGPLRGISGKLISVNADWKVVVSITLLQRSVAVIVDRSWVRPAARHEVTHALHQTA